MCAEECDREFGKLLIKCDIQELEDQTTIIYLEGLDPKCANVIEIQ